jgi:alkylation response protein AidB-like acyl-CoA dehydrogenase
MDISLSEEQRMVRAAVREILDSAAPADRWSALCQAGFLFSPDEDAFSGEERLIMLTIVAEEIGAALLTLPYAETIIAVEMLAMQPGATTAADISKRVLVGSVLVGMGSAIYSQDDCGTITASTSGEVTLASGQTGWIVGDAAPETLVVPVKIGEETALCMVETTGPATRWVEYPTPEAETLRRASLDNAAISLILAKGNEALRAADQIRHMRTILECARALGAARTAFMATRDYLAVRRQFGQALNAFQSIQHRLVNMAIELDRARSGLLLTIRSTIKPDHHQCALFARGVLNVIEATDRVVGEAVYLHGGIGITQDCKAGKAYHLVANILARLGNGTPYVDQLAEAG